MDCLERSPRFQACVGQLPGFGPDLSSADGGGVRRSVRASGPAGRRRDAHAPGADSDASVCADGGDLYCSAACVAAGQSEGLGLLNPSCLPADHELVRYWALSFKEGQYQTMALVARAVAIAVLSAAAAAAGSRAEAAMDSLGGSLLAAGSAADSHGDPHPPWWEAVASELHEGGAGDDDQKGVGSSYTCQGDDGSTAAASSAAAAGGVGDDGGGGGGGCGDAQGPSRPHTRTSVHAPAQTQEGGDGGVNGATAAAPCGRVGKRRRTCAGLEHSAPDLGAGSEGGKRWSAREGCGNSRDAESRIGTAGSCQWVKEPTRNQTRNQTPNQTRNESLKTGPPRKDTRTETRREAQEGTQIETRKETRISVTVHKARGEPLGIQVAPRRRHRVVGHTVTAVAPRSPADIAGVRVGDILVSVAGSQEAGPGPPAGSTVGGGGSGLMELLESVEREAGVAMDEMVCPGFPTDCLGLELELIRLLPVLSDSTRSNTTPRPKLSPGSSERLKGVATQAWHLLTLGLQRRLAHTGTGEPGPAGGGPRRRPVVAAPDVRIPPRLDPAPDLQYVCLVRVRANP